MSKPQAATPQPVDPPADGSCAELVRQLSQEARRLAGDVAGPLHRVSLRAGIAAVELEWDRSAQTASPSPMVSVYQPEPPAEEDRALVRSPMVGTFYHAPGPGEAPFVSVGGLVDPDTVIGIVEAMKLMNQITAEHAGVVRDVLVADGGSVEFGQPLLVLDPMPGTSWSGR